MSVSAGYIVKCKFVPSTSGTYLFYSTGSSDTYGILYNSSGSQLTSNDDSGDGNNFLISYSLTSGTTYYIGVRYYSSSYSGTIPLTIEELPKSGVCGASAQWSIDLSAGTLSITGSGAMYDYSSELTVPWYYSRASFTTLIISPEITDISSYAFFGCSGLTNVTIPDSVTSIGSSAFYGCSGLTSITIPDNVTSIG